MLFGTAIKHFTETVSEWEGFEKYVPHLEALKGNFQSKMLKVYKPNRSEFGFNVLNHADFHVRNLLFKKDAGDKIEDFLFVSVKFRVQCSLWGTLRWKPSALDLQRDFFEKFCVTWQNFIKKVLNL